MSPETEPWYTKREIAAHYKVSVRTIERLKLPCRRVGRQNRYLRSECDAELDRRESGRPDDRLNNVVELRPHRSDGAA